MAADLAERVRMALAEAGYPDAWLGGTGASPIAREYGPGAVPRRVAWRAGYVASPKRQVCWLCYSAATDARLELRDSPCLARGLSLDDCGVDRGV